MNGMNAFGHWQASVLNGEKTSFTLKELSNMRFKPTAQADTETQITQWAAQHGFAVQWRTETDPQGRTEDWVHFFKPPAGQAG